MSLWAGWPFQFPSREFCSSCSCSFCLNFGAGSLVHVQILASLWMAMRHAINWIDDKKSNNTRSQVHLWAHLDATRAGWLKRKVALLDDRRCAAFTRPVSRSGRGNGLHSSSSLCRSLVLPLLYSPEHFACGWCTVHVLSRLVLKRLS
jgi:hypothetical protein